MNAFVVALVAALVTPIAAGTDGAMDMLFDQQLRCGSLQDLDNSQHTIGVDIAGKLVPAVLKVGARVHRGKTATAHYGDVYRWLKHLVQFGIALVVVFDGALAVFDGARQHLGRRQTNMSVSGPDWCPSLGQCSRLEGFDSPRCLAFGPFLFGILVENGMRSPIELAHPCIPSSAERMPLSLLLPL
jgi:hypothetical protein